ncbi:MAG: fumarylacetoacetate hydrolase family protein [Candidatus Lambdaproteobacteria bacterium]|nr:fumarylacetoacetate hydrolase family protein [Candidatus Lambdaproteobacteria bacterium]
MKLIRFGEPDREKPGLELEDGTRLDLSDAISDYTPDFFACGGLERLKALAAAPQAFPRVPAAVRLGAPVARPGKFIAIGLNYRRHAAETGNPIPHEPILFTKYNSSICGPADDTVVPRGSTKLDYEVELAFVVKDKVRYLASERDALAHIAGFMVCNDVSERNFQSERGGQWVKGKSCDTFGPLGPWLVPAEDVPDFDRLDLKTLVNGQVRQSSNTRDMIFGVPHLLWYMSQFFTLEPGDICTTGTPEGVAHGMKPPGFLKPGDLVELTIARLGAQRHKVVPPR